MIRTRARKGGTYCKLHIPEQKLDSGEDSAKVSRFRLGFNLWSYQRQRLKNYCLEGYSVAHAHLRYINPFPKNLKSLIQSYDKVLMPEINDGQLIKLIRDKYLIDAIPMNKIQGIPFESREIKNRIIELHDGE